MIINKNQVIQRKQELIRLIDKERDEIQLQKYSDELDELKKQERKMIEESIGGNKMVDENINTPQEAVVETPVKKKEVLDLINGNPFKEGSLKHKALEYIKSNENTTPEDINQNTGLSVISSKNLLRKYNKQK